MDYGNVLKRAWQIIWRFKILWIFGILASCGQSSGWGWSNSGYRFSGNDITLSPQVERFFAHPDPAVIITLICGLAFLTLVIIVLAFLFGTVGRIGLIRGTLKAEQGAERLTFGELWREGLKYFWRVFGLNLLVGVVIFFAVMAMFVVMIVPTALTLGLCMLPLVCLLVPAMWAVAVVVEQANIALVVENLGVFEAIKQAWQVVRNNLGSMVVMSLILFLGIGLIGGLIMGLPFLIIGAPAIVGIATGTSEALRNGMLVSGVLFLVYLPVLLLLSGVLRSYTSSAWTLTYLRLTNKPSQSALEASSSPDDLDLAVPPAV